MGEIADIAGVTSGAVSNWRRRHADFPAPAEAAPSGDLFDLRAVVAWLEDRGKDFQLPDLGWADSLWQAVDFYRGRARVEEAVLFILQLLLLAHRAKGNDKVKSAALAECWERLVAHQPDELMRCIVDCRDRLAELEPGLAGALRVPTAVLEVPASRLLALVEEVLESAVDPGRVATDLLRRMEAATGKRGGEYFTPDALTQLHERLLAPIEGTVYDPAAGSAMALVECWRRRASEGTRLYGQDVNQFNWSVGSIHLALAGADFKLESGDTLRDDQFLSLRADRITADAPFSQNVPSDIRHDERWSYGVAKRNANWLWVQVVIYHLAEKGRAVMTTPLSALSAGGQDETIRKKVLESDLLDAVVELPPGLYQSTGIPVALLVFDRDRSNRAGRVLFVDGRQLGQPRRGRAHQLETQDVDQIVETLEAWRSGDFTEQPRFSSAADLQSIGDSGVDLTPKRYVRYATRISEIQGEDLQDRLARFRRDAESIAEQLEPTVSSLLGALHLPPSVRRSSYARTRMADVLIGDPTGGTRQQSDGSHDEIPYIETGLVSGGTGILRDPPVATTRGGARGRLVQRGDVLLTSRGIGSSTPAEAVIVDFDQPAAYAQSLLRLTPDIAVILPEYLLLFLRSRQGHTALSAATTGGVISNLRSDVLKEIELPLPPMKVQEDLRSQVRAVLDAHSSLAQLLALAGDAFDAFREAAVAGPETKNSGI